MDLSLDLPEETAKAFLTELGDHNLAEIAINRIEQGKHEFVDAFPDIAENLESCISRMNNLAEIDEQLISEIADRINGGMKRAQVAWEALSSLEMQDQDGSIIQLRDQAIQSVDPSQTSEKKAGFQEYQSELLGQLNGESFTSAARGNTGGAYVLSSRRAKVFARNQLGVIASFADLLEASLVTLTRLSDEDELFLIEDAAEAIEEQLQTAARQRSHHDTMQELEDFNDGWLVMFDDLNQDFKDCLCMLDQLDDEGLFEEMQTELYSSLTQAEEAWESIKLMQIPIEQAQELQQLVPETATTLRGFGQGLIGNIKTCYQTAQMDVPAEVASAVEEHLNHLLACSNTIADIRAQLAHHLDEDRDEE